MGIEPDSRTALSSNDLRQSPDSFGTETGTLQDETGTLPPDLAVVVNAWIDLSQSTREAVLRIVVEAQQDREVGSP